MEKAILPSKVYLVCSSSMMKTQLQVISQGTVTNDNKNRLIATKDDRFGEFICKYALIVAALVATAIVMSGGSLAVIIATAVAIAGVTVSLSMCFLVNLFNGGGWKQIHPSAFAEKKNMLTDKSYFTCPIGGTIIPIYNEDIASQQAAIFRNKALTQIAMSVVGGAFLAEYAAYCVAAEIGFGGYAVGMGFGFGVNVGVSKIQDVIQEKVYKPYSDEQKESPIYNEKIYDDPPSDLSYYVPKMTGDVSSVKTGKGARDIYNNREKIIKQGTENAQSQRVNPNEGSLNNPLNKNKFKTQETQIKETFGKRNYRRSQEWRKLQREKADYNRELGNKELKSKNFENLKEGGKDFAKGFDPTTRIGGLFWVSTIFETISNLVIEGEQRDLLQRATDPEAKAKAKLAVYAKRI